MVSLPLATEQSLALSPGRGRLLGALCMGTVPWGHVRGGVTP